MKFNLYKSIEFPSNENASCMRIDIFIPSQDELLYDFGKKSPLEQCLTRLLTIAELGGEDLSSTSKLIETIISLKVNEEEYVLEEATDSGWISAETQCGHDHSLF